MKRVLSLLFFVLLSDQYVVQADVLILPDTLYYNLTTTSRIDLSLAQHQRQFTATTTAYELRLSDFQNLYTSRLEVINNNQELVESSLSQLENKLNPLQLLDDISDFCVQKYRSKLPVLTTIKANFASCKQKANTAYPPIISAAETTLKNLKSYYTMTFANSLKDCKTKFVHLESNYTTCVANAIKTTTTVTNTNTHTFNNQMKAAACTADLKIREAFDCYANVLTTDLNAISEVWALVENCVAGHEFCPTCDNESTTIKGRCPYQMSWHLAENDLSSEKITNPFKGIKLNTPCLQINFINKSVQLV